ncbi:recombination activator protein 2 [Anopheles sinensis]|uniref:Recombination activator protein 2 n=1 Tax=Anopheles sinensis TaxID=74873 RepID=A0A084VG95_ANOSI|nr:recombination activator protein 2 [Anopheles sinensis]
MNAYRFPSSSQLPLLIDVPEAQYVHSTVYARAETGLEVRKRDSSDGIVLGVRRLIPSLARGVRKADCRQARNAGEDDREDHRSRNLLGGKLYLKTTLRSLHQSVVPFPFPPPQNRCPVRAGRVGIGSATRPSRRPACC